MPANPPGVPRRALLLVSATAPALAAVPVGVDAFATGPQRPVHIAHGPARADGSGTSMFPADLRKPYASFIAFSTTTVATAAPTTTSTSAPATAPAGVPPYGAATVYGCAAALAYLHAYDAPGFVAVCPGDAWGHEALTCFSEGPCAPGQRMVVVADPCPAAYMNEAHNSWVASNEVLGTPIPDGNPSFDPYGAC